MLNPADLPLATTLDNYVRNQKIPADLTQRRHVLAVSAHLRRLGYVPRFTTRDSVPVHLWELRPTHHMRDPALDRVHAHLASIERDVERLHLGENAKIGVTAKTPTQSTR